jgi:hypothetical protein
MKKTKKFQKIIRKNYEKITNYDKMIEIHDESSSIFKTKIRKSEVISLKTKETIRKREELRTLKKINIENYNEFIKIRKKCKKNDKK